MSLIISQESFASQKYAKKTPIFAVITFADFTNCKKDFAEF